MAEQKSIREGEPRSKTEEYERALAAEEGTEKYNLRLYVSGATAKSLRAIQNIKHLCETRLKGRYSLEIIDVYQHPLRVAEDQIVAAPTLVKELPPPVRKLIGDLSTEEHVLVGLDIVKR